MTESSTNNAGGIGWAGSLVGSQNPDNLGYRYSTPCKRFRRSDDDKEQDLPSNLVVQFQNRQGQSLGDALDLPTNSSIDDLNEMVHSLLNPDVDDTNNKRIPYAFYAKLLDGEDQEITSTLADLLSSQKIIDRTRVAIHLPTFLAIPRPPRHSVHRYLDRPHGSRLARLLLPQRPAPALGRRRHDCALLGRAHVSTPI